MSSELTKMNLIAIVQQLPEEDIKVVETYIKAIEEENKELNKKINALYTLLKIDKEKIDYWVNIFEELEKWLKSFSTEEFNYNFLVVRVQDILDKIDELKGDKENE